ncbi:MAG: N-acetylneuraminate synthase [Parcubacteria group bacterium Gr01-1014_44]|nr:MAG: N-acetylneuraminate synthase [Parcubacteria group bacterium Gr01-1014_44]
MVKIGDKTVGHDQPVFVTAEIGINHNGDMAVAKKLIDLAVLAGCDAVKFQKRTVEVVYTPEELAKPRENPFGPTNGDLKRGLEFGREQYEEISYYCCQKEILWFASPWDEESVDFLEEYNPPCYKIASASLTDDGLLRHIRSKGRPIILSTGMSDMAMIRHAVAVLGHVDLVLLHCTSVYPKVGLDSTNNLSFVNLKVIDELGHRFPSVPIGFSSHFSGIMPVYAAVARGACMVEFHITLERSMWGSDQASSLEFQEFNDLCRMIRELKIAEGDGIKRIYPEEEAVMKKLRRK